MTNRSTDHYWAISTGGTPLIRDGHRANAVFLRVHANMFKPAALSGARQIPKAGKVCISVLFCERCCVSEAVRGWCDGCLSEFGMEVLCISVST